MSYSCCHLSCSLFGMVRHHVTALAAIFVCNLMLTSAQSAPNTALLKLLSTKHAHGLGRYDNSPASAPSANDVNELWLDPDYVPDAPKTPASAGNHMTDVETEGEDDKFTERVSLGKRFHPSAFFGSRGKRTYMAVANDGLSKRFQMGFVGSRGKRLLPHLGGGAGEEQVSEVRRFDPSGFSGSRGKRYMPGLEALLLSQMYKKLDAEKWKRQSLLGFHAARG